MSRRCLSLCLILFLMVSIISPIFATNYGNTKITKTTGERFHDTYIPVDGDVYLRAKLWLRGPPSYEWSSADCRGLDFYVYKSNYDGSNGELIFQDRKFTEPISAIARAKKFTISEIGEYNLIISYAGNIGHNLDPCQATAKIYVR